MPKKLLNLGLLSLILICWGWYFTLYAESPLFIETEGKVISHEEVITTRYSQARKGFVERVSYPHQVEYEALGEVRTAQMTLGDGNVPYAPGTAVSVFFNGSDPTQVRHGSAQPNWIWAGMVTLILGSSLLNRIYMSS